MLELIDRSSKIRRFLYFQTAALLAAVLIWRLPDVLLALKQAV
ncbi:hypothetical protein V6667_02665 [Neisseria leonii]|uniref:Uncharacterized protein n=1 Tax=Neisseria leonii TaxID=2995413 RepID=A0AAQ3UZ56_9NEIS